MSGALLDQKAIGQLSLWAGPALYTGVREAE
jgi:hypothetical protein